MNPIYVVVFMPSLCGDSDNELVTLDLDAARAYISGFIESMRAFYTIQVWEDGRLTNTLRTCDGIWED